VKLLVALLLGGFVIGGTALGQRLERRTLVFVAVIAVCAAGFSTLKVV
jgi:hypothetical protein